MGRALQGADYVVASDLTLIECERALHRAEHLGKISAEDRERLALELAQCAASWTQLSLSEDIVARARGPFPGEPNRSLDALHLASALSAKALIPELALLSLDDRMCRSGRALGLRVFTDRR